MFTGAYFYPLPDNAVIRSATESIPNGGRKEDFYINLELDRIAPAQEVRVAGFPVREISSRGNQVIRAEVFKLRNSRREVIGLASRMTGLAPDVLGEPEVVVNWLLMIPGRGGLMLSQGDMPAAGLLPDGIPFKQGLFVSGDGVFADLVGSYAEAELFEDMNSDGTDEPVVLLSTRLQARDGA